MALIRKKLYQELVTGRSERFKKLETSQNELKVIVDSIKVEQGFVDGFSKTQVDLDASKKALEASVTEQKALLTKLKDEKVVLDSNIKNAKESVEASQEALKKQQEKLAELKEEGASASDIAAQQILVDSAESVVSANQTKVEVADASLKANLVAQAAATKTIETDTKAIDETNKQIEDNNEKKKESTDKLEELKEDETDATAQQTKTQTEYNNFLSENKETISLYEAQQIKRDANVPKVYGSTSQVFYRAPDNSTVIAEADTVMKGVIDDELAPADEKETEALKGYVTAGASEAVNPDFLNASSAKDLSLSVIWSTRTVARQIKKACMRGEFSTTTGSLPNSVIYALQQAQYKIYLTDATNDLDASIIISWENIAS